MADIGSRSAPVTYGMGEFARADLGTMTVERQVVEVRMEYGFDLGLSHRTDFTDPRDWEILLSIGSRHGDAERCATDEGYRREVGKWLSHGSGNSGRIGRLSEVAKCAYLSGRARRRPEGIVVASAIAHQDFALRFYAWDGTARLGSPVEGLSRESVHAACDEALILARRLHREGFRHDRYHDTEGKIYAAQRASRTLAKAAAVLNEGHPVDTWLI